MSIQFYYSNHDLYDDLEPYDFVQVMRHVNNVILEYERDYIPTYWDYFKLLPQFLYNLF